MGVSFLQKISSDLSSFSHLSPHLRSTAPEVVALMVPPARDIHALPPPTKPWPPERRSGRQKLFTEQAPAQDGLEVIFPSAPQPTRHHDKAASSEHSGEYYLLIKKGNQRPPTMEALEGRTFGNRTVSHKRSF